MRDQVLCFVLGVALTLFFGGLDLEALAPRRRKEREVLNRARRYASNIDARDAYEAMEGTVLMGADRVWN